MATMLAPLPPLLPLHHRNYLQLTFPPKFKSQTLTFQIPIPNNPLILKPYNLSQTTSPFLTSSDSDSDSDMTRFNQVPGHSNGGATPPLLKRRKRYRKEYPGESKGITEEMRFVAMKLRNDKGSRLSGVGSDGGDESEEGGGSWEPSVVGFVKYLVDFKVVFDTLENVVEDSTDVSYAYFRKTGLERSESLARDLESFRQQGIAIPEPSDAGVSYATYLKELGEKSAPLFLSHFYNVHFSHIAGGQVIAKQVSKKVLQGRVLEFYKWEGEAEELLKEVRDKLNKLSEHWSRDDKNKCLKEATKSFRYLGQIVRLIIL